MSEIPWSGKPKVDDLVVSDIVMRRTPSRGVKNQEIPFSDILTFVYENIAALTDGSATITPDAQVVFVEGGTAFRGTIRPNPARQINVTSQGQLQAQFGVNIEIPDGESWLISVDDSFALSVPIKLGLGSAIRIQGQVSTTIITYTGAGAMFQNTNAANLIDSFDIRLIRITGDGTNSAFDLIGDSFFFINTVQIVEFDSIGFIDMDLVEINSLGIFAVNQGLTIKDAAALSIKVIVIDQTGVGDTGMTVFSVIQNVASLVILDDMRAVVFSAGESLIFFDPNAPVGTSYVITNATKILGNLFQPGTDIAATANAASGSDTQFDITAHNLIVGQVVVLKDFTTFAGYNGTFRVTAVNGVNSVDIEVGFLGVDATGTMSAKSLDSTDVLVSAFNNPMEPDSMFTAESGYEDSGAADTTINTVNVPEVIVNANFAFSNLERFAEGVTNQGQIITLDSATRRYSVGYSGSLSKGAGAVIMGLVLLKNGSIVGFNPPRAPSGTSAQIGGLNIIELSETDTLQIGVINYTNDNNIAVTHLDLVVNRA